jgi:DNA primase
VAAPHWRPLPPPQRSGPGRCSHPTSEDAALLSQVVTYYHEQLKQSPEALAYLESRGLNRPELIEHFPLGFANRTLGYHLPKKALKAGAEIRARLQRLGVLRESGHEHFNGSVVVPVFDAAGAVVQLYGRKITPRLREGTPSHLYLPGPRRGVWNREALQSRR